MIKYITIFILIVISQKVMGQLDTTKLDTVRAFVHVSDTTHYWDYFNANGVLAWGYVVGYDPALIPPGGSAKRNYYKNQFSIVKGFGVIKCDTVVLLTAKNINS